MGRDPDLVHGMRRVRLEVVNKRHKTACLDCSQRPAIRRLLVLSGSGLPQKREIRCVDCGAAWLSMRVAEFERAVVRLRTGQGKVRV